MQYLFTNIIGAFVLDDKFHIVDSIPFIGNEYEFKTKTENRLRDKHKNLIPLPVEKYVQASSIFKDPKYAKEFFQKNLVITKQAIKDAVNEDNLIIQTVSNLNELDKTSNMLTKRLREWFSLYLPEFSQVVQNHEKFVELVTSLSKKELMKDIGITKTMGADLEEVHVNQILLLGKEIETLYKLRAQHEAYLQKIMKKYCPNLLELAGATIGAKLLELGKGLKRVALLPASTVQLLGAEKALFRHLKTGSRSPKYGVIFQHPLIQKSKKKDRGRMARSLADKLSLCARLDFFKGEFKAKEYRGMLEVKMNSR